MAIVVKLLRIISLLALPVALAACSTLKLGYGALPELAFWRLDAHLDFDDTQSARVRDDLAQYQRWHRGTELPRYVALLAQAEQLADGEFTAAQACALVAQGRERMAAAAAQAEPQIASLAMSLTPAQLQHLQKHYDRKDTEWRKDWLDLPPAALLDKRAKQIIERSEMFYGTLDDAQRALVRQSIAQSAWDAQAFYAERQRRQRDALQTLRTVSTTPGITPEQARTAVRGWLQRSMESPDASWIARRTAWLQDACRGAAALHATTTAAQRASAVNRLRAYQRDLRELSAQR